MSGKHDQEKISENKLNQEFPNPSLEGKDNHLDSNKWRGVPKRYILLLMTFIGFVNIYAMRVNLNVALIAMVNNQTIIRRGEKVIKVRTPY